MRLQYFLFSFFCNNNADVNILMHILLFTCVRISQGFIFRKSVCCNICIFFSNFMFLVCHLMCTHQIYIPTNSKIFFFYILTIINMRGFVPTVSNLVGLKWNLMALFVYFFFTESICGPLVRIYFEAKSMTTAILCA